MRRAPVMHQPSRRHFFALVCLPVIVVISLAARMHASEPASVGALQQLIDDLKAELKIDAAVSAAIVKQNSLLVSVERVDAPGNFRMEFEERFLSSLDQDELKAIIAHELGHVW